MSPLAQNSSVPAASIAPQEVVVSCAFELRMEHKGDTLESYDLRTGELRHVVDVEVTRSLHPAAFLRVMGHSF
jgi:hypothetical protein